MYRIDTDDASITPPAIPAEGTKKYFQDTESAGGTKVPAWWLQGFDSEMENVIVGAGNTPSKADNTQILTAINQLIATAGMSATNPNYLYNSGLLVDIEGNAAGVTNNNEYAVEAWELSCTTNSRVTVSRDTSVTPTTSGYSYKIDVTSTQTPATTDHFSIIHRLEGNDVSDLKIGNATDSKTVTFSIKVRSSLIGKYCVYLQNSAANRSYVFEIEILVADTWETKTKTINLDTAGTWLIDNGVGIKMGITFASGTTYDGTADTWTASDIRATTNQVNLLASTSHDFYFAEPKLEEGLVATKWELPNYAAELNNMNRFFAIIQGMYLLSAISGQNPSWMFPNSMRIAPTITVLLGGGSGATFSAGVAGAYQNVNNSVDTACNLQLDSRLL